MRESITSNKELIKEANTRLHEAIPLEDYGDGFAIATIEELLDQGANINAQNRDGETPLYLAVQHCPYWWWKAEWEVETESDETINFLLERGANVNICDRFGVSPLHIAAEQGLIDVMEALLNKGADIEIRDNKGNTPLFYAILSNDYHPDYLEWREDAVRLLLERGANVNARNNAGETPLDIALRENQEKIVALLREFKKGVPGTYRLLFDQPVQ